MSRPAVLVMAKAPIAGRVKTRLSPLFTPSECAALQTELITRTVRWAIAVAPSSTYLAYDPPSAVDALRALVPAEVTLLHQTGDHLGERLVAATAAVFERERGPLLVVGVDTRLVPAHAEAALAEIVGGVDVVYGPARDGGYYLAALAQPAAEAFAIDPGAWGGDRVLELSLAAVTAAGLHSATIGAERDLDTPEDAAELVGDPEIGGRLAAALSRRDPDG